MLGELAMRIEIGRLLVMKAAWELDRGGFARKEVSMAKVQVAEALHEAADIAIQINGARGYSKDTVLEWIYRYARQARLVDGADEVHKMVLSRSFSRQGRRPLELGMIGAGGDRRGLRHGWRAKPAAKPCGWRTSPRSAGARSRRTSRSIWSSKAAPLAGRHECVLRAASPAGVAASLHQAAGIRSCCARLSRRAWRPRSRYSCATIRRCSGGRSTSCAARAASPPGG